MQLCLLITVLFALGCVSQSHTKEDREADHKMVQEHLSGEVSLKADREELAELRKEVPEEKRKSNDELALYLNIMKQGSEQPQMVRDKFNAILSKKRATFRDKVTKVRDTFTKGEKKRREEYLDAQKKKRESFTSSKHTSNETREFFAEQEKDRQNYFADERDRRKSFESDVTAESKDFDSYMREKSNEFNEQYRIYSKKFSERDKPKKAVTGSDQKGIDDVPAQPLGN